MNFWTVVETGSAPAPGAVFRALAENPGRTNSILPPLCAAVIPCFNEADNIAAVVAGVTRFLATVLVVDDGSSDGTADRARAAGAEVVRLPCNSGKGAALRLGWRRVAEMGFQWVLMLDGDGQHAADDIPAFFAAAEQTGARLVIGNRMNNAPAMPPLRRWVNRWMSRRLSHLTGTFLPDSQCGFRLAHLETLCRLPLTAQRFQIESEMLVTFLAAEEEIAFVPIQTIYRNRSSKIHPLTDTARWLRWRFAQRKIALGVPRVRNHSPAIENGITASA